MNKEFETDYKTILQKIENINPVKYGSTRNFINGAVTYLSPYISRGVISTKQVLETVLEKGYDISQITPFVKELCWRDYFQRVAQVKNLNTDLKQPQSVVLNKEIPSLILKATTGIKGIDNAIATLYATGYMHNHCRMYTASIVCNIAKSHWQHPAQWLYYHLLDGDWASNVCSWQWVAGANSSKKYFANQENISKYTFQNQVGTYLDTSYEVLEKMQVPESLLTVEKADLVLEIPHNVAITVEHSKPTFIYNYYNLDPLWRKDESGNRILLIEPDFFESYPVSKKCIDFMLSLSKNIPDIQIFTGSFETLSQKYDLKNIYFKEHPFNNHYIGKQDSRDWIVNEVSGYYPSFFAYWKKIEKVLQK